MVYVISIDGKPLMPCKPVIARLLLKQHKAKVIKNFTGSNIIIGAMAELVDARDLKSLDCKIVWVQIPFAPTTQ